MLKNTYFAVLPRIKAENPDAVFIAVCRMLPPNAQSDLDHWKKELSPSMRLLSDYKKELIDWDKYSQRFEAEMMLNGTAQMTMKWIKIISEQKDVYLVCWEGPDKNCHRHLLIKMISEMQS